MCRNTTMFIMGLFVQSHLHILILVEFSDTLIHYLQPDVECFHEKYLVVLYL